MSYHATSVAVINGEGTELQTVTVFTTADEYIEFNFGADGKFIHIFVGTTNDEENEWFVVSRMLESAALALRLNAILPTELTGLR